MGPSQGKVRRLRVPPLPRMGTGSCANAFSSCSLISCGVLQHDPQLSLGLLTGRLHPECQQSVCMPLHAHRSLHHHPWLRRQPELSLTAL